MVNVNIQFRSLATTLDAIKHTSAAMAANFDGSDAEFYAAAWSLAEAFTPVVSDPLSFIFDPVNIVIYGEDLGLKKQQQFIQKLFEEKGDPDSIKAMPCIDKHAYILRYKLLVKALEAVKDTGLHECKSKNKLRTWLRDQIPVKKAKDISDRIRRRGQSSGARFGYPTAGDDLDAHLLDISLRSPDIPDEPLPLEWLHLAGFWAFHKGMIKGFAERMQKAKFEEQDLFWETFFKWHAGKPDKDALLNLVKDDKLSLGKRKLALLLALSVPTTSRQAAATIKLARSHRMLLDPTIEYRGSGLLPCRPFKIPSTRSIDDILKELEEAVKALSKKSAEKHWKEQVMPLVEEVMGGSAACVDFGAQIDLLTKPDLRAMVYGCGEIERQSAVFLLMQFPRVSKRNPLEWNNGDIVESYSSLKSAIRAKKGAPEKIAGLLGNPCHLKGIHSWTPDGIDLTARLLDHDIENVVIGSQAIDEFGKIDGDTSLSLRLQGVTIQIPLLSDSKRRGDIDELMKKFLGNKQINNNATFYLRKIIISSLDDLVFLLQEAGKNTDNIQPADIERAVLLKYGFKPHEYARSVAAEKFSKPDKMSPERHSRLSDAADTFGQAKWKSEDLRKKARSLQHSSSDAADSETTIRNWIKAQLTGNKIERFGKTNSATYKIIT